MILPNSAADLIQGISRDKVIGLHESAGVDKFNSYDW
jgi:hypothetical protein